MPAHRRPDLPAPVVAGDWTAAVMSSKGQRDGRWLWYARHRDRAAHPSLSLGRLETREVARALVEAVQALEASVAAALPAKPSRDGKLETWADACEYWSGEQGQRERRGRIERNSRRAYKDSARRLKVLIGDMPIQARVQVVIDRYVERSTHAANTQRQDVGVIGSVFTWLAGLGLVQLTTWEAPRWRDPQPVYRDRVPEPHEVALVLQAMPAGAWYRGAVLLFAATGLRLQELAAVQPQDLDLWAEDELGFLRVGLYVGARKTGEREVPIRGAALAWAREHLTGAEKAWPVGRGTFSTCLRTHILAACKAAKVEAFTPKGLRAMASTSLQEQGVSGLAYESIMGHSERTGRRDYAERRRAMLAGASAQGGLGDLPGVVVAVKGGKKP